MLPWGTPAVRSTSLEKMRLPSHSLFYCVGNLIWVLLSGLELLLHVAICEGHCAKLYQMPFQHLWRLTQSDLQAFCWTIWKYALSALWVDFLFLNPHWNLFIRFLLIIKRVILVVITLSNSFPMTGKRDIGRYEVGLEDSLLGFKIIVIMEIFHLSAK